MSLQAPEFFAELCLPFHHSTVVGATYFAIPVPDGPLRLRIAFTGALHADTYGGLRLAVIHPDRGEIDAVALSFVDHGTFHRRDEANNTSPNSKQYGTFDTYRRPGRQPWEGAVTTRLADAIQQYTEIWFPGAWRTSAARRAAGRTAHKVPAPHATHAGGRAR
ncbi:hypothetical protein [Streptomyces sp. H39-C1]|uniref:hypothetical protein n=1 Tax=Streptomyces sp. H39-C1 TaxID=3004355 RepID=UPI0022AF65B3|nr:hypothetical protein [Streptomyces sp. H39-C1]MCZ4102903.1 hypothetical protein [Streptomyces sp. H39-C1]